MAQKIITEPLTKANFQDFGHAETLATKPSGFWPYWDPWQVATNFSEFWT